jgi:hypothetical protein
MNTPMNLNDFTGRNSVDLSQVSAEVRQLLHFYTTRGLSTQVLSDNEIEISWNAISNEVQFLTNDQWHVGQDVRHVVFQAIFVFFVSMFASRGVR